MGSYQDHIESLSPPWLRSPRARHWLRSLGDIADSMIGPTKEAVFARFPELAPEDALAALGKERGLPRGPGESTSAYAQRVVKAWELWPWAGTPFGMLTAFRTAGYQVLIQVVRGKQYSLDAAGELVISGLPAGSWACDATPEFWSKFVVMFATLPAGWSVTGGGVTTPAEDSAEAETIREIIRKWKPAHATCDRIILRSSGELWGYPGGTWGDAGTWAGAVVGYWNP